MIRLPRHLPRHAPHPGSCLPLPFPLRHHPACSSHSSRPVTATAAQAKPDLLLHTPSGPTKIKVVSFDVTGTLLVHRYPIMDTYAQAAVWARLPDPPTSAELKPAFKKAYFESLTGQEAFRNHPTLFSSRQWWVGTVRRALEYTGRSYSDAEFGRFFRRVYQHYGSLEGYEVLEDALPFLDWLAAHDVTLGITTNTPARTLETVLPMLGLHERFRWFVCCQDVGVEKPGAAIYDAAFSEAQFWSGEGLQRSEVLHIGDNLAADFCGAKASGFQALHLDRSDNARVTVYQDWLQAPDYPGKSEADIQTCSVKSLGGVQARLCTAA